MALEKTGKHEEAKAVRRCSAELDALLARGMAAQGDVPGAK
jgi:hypothetical protein